MNARKDAGPRLDAAIAVTASAAVVTALFAAITLMIGVLAIVRGTSTIVAPVPLLIAALGALCTVVAARRIDFEAVSESVVRSSLRLGAVAVAISTMVLVTLAAMADSDGFRLLDLFTVIACSLVLVAAVPAAQWLARDSHLQHALRWALRAWSKSGDPQDGSGSRISVAEIQKGATVASLALDRDPHSERRETEARSTADWVLSGLIVLTLGAGLVVVLSSGALGHDESVYAVKARAMYSGSPGTGWAVYRPPGMAAIGWVILHFSDADLALRLVSITLSIGTALATWFTGRIIFDRATATLAVGVFIAATAYLRRATEFLNDLPAAMLLILAMLAVWYHFERKPNGWWLVAAAPLGAAAYYLRYGSAVPLVVVAVMATLVWHRSIARTWRQIAVTAAVFITLLIPHVLYSVSETGSVLGVLESQPTLGGFGLSTYVEWLPSRLAGTIGGLLIRIAAVYAIYMIVAYVRNRDLNAPELRRTMFLFGTALSVFIVLGVTIHAEARYIFLPLMLALIVGSRPIVRIVSALRHVPRFSVAMIGAAIVLFTFVSNVPVLATHMDNLATTKNVLFYASDVVEADADGAECTIRSTYVPQLTWYTQCATYLFRPTLPSVDPLYLVIFENGKRQPTGDDLKTEIARTEVLLAGVEADNDRIGDASVYLYPPVADR